jgi:hypothetical protein
MSLGAIGSLPHPLVASTHAAGVVTLIVRVLIAKRRGYSGDATHVLSVARGATCSQRSGSLEHRSRPSALEVLGFSRCQVAQHWSLVRRVREAELTTKERRSAEQYRHKMP